jgi:phage terminase small subunit
MIKPLTPIQLRFIEAYVRYGNASKALRLTYPDEHKQWSQSYIGTKANRMMKNDDIQAEIVNRKAVMQANASMGAQRIQKIIKDGKEHNALAASIFSVEQADGKAKQVTETTTQHTFVTYDLSGGTAGAVPAEIMAQLKG